MCVDVVSWLRGVVVVWSSGGGVCLGGGEGYGIGGTHGALGGPVGDLLERAFFLRNRRFETS
eukprot:984709-Prorocentrum_lima.AAC.1